MFFLSNNIAYGEISQVANGHTCYASSGLVMHEAVPSLKNITSHSLFLHFHFLTPSALGLDIPNKIPKFGSCFIPVFLVA
jgi:hypothetical protein